MDFRNQHVALERQRFADLPRPDQSADFADGNRQGRRPDDHRHTVEAIILNKFWPGFPTFINFEASKSAVQAFGEKVKSFVVQTVSSQISCIGRA